MTSPATTDHLAGIAEMAWRSRLWRYANVASGGEWKAARHLVYAAERIQEVIEANLDGDSEAPEIIIIELPPRHGKSWLCSKWLPIWFLDSRPHLNVLLVSYNARHAARWGRRVRNEIQARKEILVELTKDSTARHEWETVEGGGMKTAGIDGVVGEGGQLIIVDDPHKNWREAHSPIIRGAVIDSFAADVWTRREPGATVLVMQQRQHEDDLAGHLQAEADADSEGSHRTVVIRMPAIAEEDCCLGREPGEALWPERHSIEKLERTRTRLGTRRFGAQFQQRPAPEEGNEINRDWIRFYRRKDLPPPSTWQFLCVSLDATFKGVSDSASGQPDWVVMQAWCAIGMERYLLDQSRGRWTFTETLHHVDRFVRCWSGDLELQDGQERPGWAGLTPENRLRAIYIEDKANGPAILSAFRNRFSGLTPVDPGKYGGKLERMRANAPLWEAGNVLIPHPDEAEWVESTFLREHLLFPSGKNDDCVDAANQALLLMPVSERREAPKEERRNAALDDLLGSI